MWWPLTLNYIFKVIWLCLWKSRLVCNLFSSRSILSIFATKITTIKGCVTCQVYNKILKQKSTFLLAFFPYLEQIIISFRGCVACNDLWPWPISSKSFGLDLENRVRSVAPTVLDGFFAYLVQMITSMIGCVACDDLWPWPISSRSFDLDFFHICHI